MKFISNFILIFSICSTIKYILLEKLKLNDYERIINIVLYIVQLIAFLRILIRFLKA